LSLLPGRSPQSAPLVFGGTSPHARGDLLVYRPGQARGLRWAGPADAFGLADLAQCGPYRADREEEVGIGVAAGGIVTPAGVYGHRANFDRIWRITVPVRENPIRIAYSLLSSYASLSPTMVTTHHLVHVISPTTPLPGHF
jgi:hypothetical protein